MGKPLERPLRGFMASIAVVAGLLICAAMPARAQTPAPQMLPDCTAAGQNVSLDLSTVSSTSTALVVDPHWTVNGGSAYHTSRVVSWANQTNWIQPSAMSTPDPNVWPGDYTYQTQFYIPCDPSSYSNLMLQLSYAADNSVTVHANAWTSYGCSGSCFGSMHTVTVPAASLIMGLNTITAVVHNSNQWSGLAMDATLSGTCGAICPVAPRSLAIRKVVTNPYGPGLYPAATTFPISVTCTDSNGVSNHSFNLPADTNASPIDNLTLNSQCHVDETLPADFVTPSGMTCTWEPPVYSAQDVTIGNGVTQVVITNSFKCPPGIPATFNKVIVHPSYGNSASVVSSQTFSVQYNCSVGNGWVSVPANGSATAVLPISPWGGTCKAIEATPASFSGNCPVPLKWSTLVVSPSGYFVPSTQQLVTVTNTYQCPSPPGSLTVKKAIYDPQNIVPANSSFQISVACTDLLNVTTTYPLNLTGNATSVPISNLVPGSECWVSETLPLGFGWNGQTCDWMPPSYSTENVTIASGSQTVTITNVNTCEIPTGSLTVFKKIVDSASPLIPVVFGPWTTLPTFTVNVFCGGQAPTSVSVTPPILLSTIGNLPYGTYCTVQESTLPPSFTDSQGNACTWQQQAPLVQSVPITGSTQSVTVTNAYICAPPVQAQSQTGSLTVTKTIRDWNPGWQPQDAFPVSVNCGSAGTFNFTLTGDGAAHTIPNLPANASCTVTETPTNPPLTSYGTWCPALYPQGQTIAIQPAPAITTLPIRNRYGDCTTW